MNQQVGEVSVAGLIADLLIQVGRRRHIAKTFLCLRTANYRML